MNNIKNGMPNIYFTGTDDQSTSALEVVNESRPVHMPLIWTFAQKGKPVPFVAGGKGLVDMLGAETFNARGLYYNHTTSLLEEMNGLGNLCQVQRLIPADAATARMRISLELVSQEVPLYERDAQGNYIIDATGNKIPTGSSIPGFIGQWLVEPIVDGDNSGFASGTTKVGTLVGDAGEASTVYPIHDIAVSSAGQWGNGVGIRMYPTYTNGTTPIDDEVVASQAAYIYSLEVYEKPTPKSSPVQATSLTGVKVVPFAYKEGAVNPNSDSDLYVEDVIMPSFRDLDDYSTGVAAYGPFDAFHTYHANVALVSELIFNTELGNTEFGTLDVEEGKYLVNFMQARNIDGVPYHSFMLKGLLDGAAELNSVSTHYCKNGADGDTSLASLDALVADQLMSFGELGYDFSNLARYPFSCLYDTGFSVATKKLIPRVLGVRPNVHVALGTHQVGGPELSVAEESSLAVSLRAALRAYPESTFYGTSACRGVIIRHACTLAGSTFKERVPATFQLAKWRARYMGAGDGAFKSDYAYDSETGKIVSDVKDITNMEVPFSVRNKDWDNGLNGFIYHDTKNAFAPAVKTVYDNDTSILTSDINMQIMCELNTVAFYVWRDLVGNAKLSKEQIAERSDERILEYTQFRFDGRVVIVPETYYTEADSARGFSWSTRINMYGNNMPTVNTATVITHRLEDLV